MHAGSRDDNEIVDSDEVADYQMLRQPIRMRLTHSLRAEQRGGLHIADELGYRLIRLCSLCLV